MKESLLNDLGTKLGTQIEKKSLYHFKKGEMLFYQGSASNGVFCMAEGMVKIFATGIEGREIILQFAGPHDMLGYDWLFGPREHAYSAQALEDTLCCYFEAVDFQHLLRQNFDLTTKLIKKMGTELEEAHGRNIHLIKDNVRQRLASYFTFMARNFGSKDDGHIRINIRLSREELASYIGTAHETTIRFISEFKSLGLIKEEQKYFYIKDWEGLLMLEAPGLRSCGT